MREKIAFLLIPLALVVGFFAGRQFPNHYYERFGKGPFMYDRPTGKLCDPRPPFAAEQDKQLAARGIIDPNDKNPPCGSE
jgi:hypothetical protein